MSTTDCLIIHKPYMKGKYTFKLTCILIVVFLVLCFRTAIINEDMKLQKEFEDNEKQLLKKLKRVNSFKILLSDAKSEILKLTTFFNLCK